MKFLLLFFLINAIHGYKILLLMPSASKSHTHVTKPIISELAKRGHHITVVSSYTFPKPIQNVREIVPKPMIEDFSMFAKQVFAAAGTHVIPVFLSYKFLLGPTCENYLTNPEVKELLKQGKQFDLVMVSQILNDCALATAPLLGKNIMYFSASNLVPWLPTSVPQPRSYVPSSLSPYGSKMTFFQRLDNVVSWFGMRLIMDYIFIPHVQGIIAKHLPENPSVMEARQMVSFAMTNADPVITSPRPSVPNVVNVGGMHCKKPNPVPKEFEDFIQSSGENGFILFCLGSNVDSKDIPDEVKERIVNALGRLKQHVIWKHEKELDNCPKNVKITKWLPQQDILGHPKIRLFITHGGMLSLQESVYNAVPVVAVPLFAEQPGNVARIEEIGIGVKLLPQNISETSLYEAVTKVLDDKRYAENVKKYSVVFHDFIENQVEKAAYWVEYVIRHDGAHHLRNQGEDMNYIQYFLLDVIVFLLAILITMSWGSVKLCKIATRKFCSCKKAKIEKSKEKKEQ
uniref:UDP-glucuronosyltransferase n=1 Tax=Strigamia maritima TaxID=126957 RepID=T1IR52_STRMM|nr:UDP-glycosyltransferase 211F1 [Strigamia maritima]